MARHVLARLYSDGVPCIHAQYVVCVCMRQFWCCLVDLQVVGIWVKSGRRGQSTGSTLETLTNGDQFKIRLDDGSFEALSKWQALQAVTDFKSKETDGWVTQGPFLLLFPARRSYPRPPFLVFIVCL